MKDKGARTFLESSFEFERICHKRRSLPGKPGEFWSGCHMNIICFSGQREYLAVLRDDSG